MYKYGKKFIYPLLEKLRRRVITRVKQSLSMFK